MKQGTIAGIVIDFVMVAVTFTVFELLWKHGLQISRWDVEQTRVNYNLTIAAVLAILWFLRGRWK